MHYIVGGAYQGKRSFAVRQYAFSEDQIGSCTEDAVDFSKPCICHIERFARGCAARGEDAAAFFESHRAQWRGSVLIQRDISGGIVPISPLDRAWQEENGRLSRYLAENGDRVSRMVCGLEQRLK